MKKFPLLALPLVLSACTGYWPNSSTMPTGYTHHDHTPISSPHGYSKTLADETAFRTSITENREAWRDGIAQILNPMTAALDMNVPVAIAMDPGMTPLNSSAANYLRDLLIDMSYLTALPGETPQKITIAARPTSEDSIFNVRLAIHRGPVEMATNNGQIIIPHQKAESLRLPGFTKTPATGPDATPARPYSTLNQD